MSEIKIVAAALRMRDVIISLPAPNGHDYILRKVKPFGLFPDGVGIRDQGFLTSDGKFVDRLQAHKIAYIAGQTFKKPGHGSLTTEDLW